MSRGTKPAELGCIASSAEPCRRLGLRKLKKWVLSTESALGKWHIQHAKFQSALRCCDWMAGCSEPAGSSGAGDGVQVPGCISAGQPEVPPGAAGGHRLQGSRRPGGLLQPQKVAGQGSCTAVPVLVSVTWASHCGYGQCHVRAQQWHSAVRNSTRARYSDV